MFNNESNLGQPSLEIIFHIFLSLQTTTLHFFQSAQAALDIFVFVIDAEIETVGILSNILLPIFFRNRTYEFEQSA